MVDKAAEVWNLTGKGENTTSRREVNFYESSTGRYMVETFDFMKRKEEGFSHIFYFDTKDEAESYFNGELIKNWLAYPHVVLMPPSTEEEPTEEELPPLADLEPTDTEPQETEESEEEEEEEEE